MSGVIESMVTVRCHQGLCPWCFSPKINLSLNASFSSLTLTFLLDEAFCLEWYLWRQTYLPNATNLSSICTHDPQNCTEISRRILGFTGWEGIISSPS